MTHAKTGKNHSHRILIVEDEADLRLVLSKLLKDRGFEVTSAEGAIEAIGHLETNSYDLILSDVRMPKGSARDLLNWLNRAQQEGSRTPVVLMSGNSEVIEYLACQLGVEMFLVKPLEFDVLMKAFDQVLNPKFKKAN